MLAWLEQFLVRYPELALFLVISAGYWIGNFKVGAFSLGPVTGALFAFSSVSSPMCRSRG
jgi:putative transport protein